MTARVEVDASRSRSVMPVGSFGYGYGPDRTVRVELSVSFDLADAPIAKEELERAVEKAREELGLFPMP